MKTTSTTRTIEFTFEESSVTIHRKRTIVRQDGEAGQADRISEVEERNAEIPTNRSERERVEKTQSGE